jgi:hypothetical protein
LGPELSTTLTQFTRCDAAFVPETTDVAIIERPPLLEVAEYFRRYAEVGR